MKKFSIYFVFVLFAVFLYACGGGKEIAVKVSGLKLDSSSSASLDSVNINSDSTHSTLAHVDGLKMKISEIVLIKDNGDGVTVLSYSPYKEITLTQDGNNENVLTDTGNIESGTYINAGIHYKEEYSLKAYACLGTTRYYTTSSGIQHDTISGDCTAPTTRQYDYYHYDFMYTTTSESPTSTDDDGSDYSQYFGGVTIDENNVSNIQFLFDIYRTVRFWDGQGDINDAGAPFTWTNNNGQSNKDFFPSGQPNFGVSYIPIHVSVGDKGTTTGEIYAINDTNDFSNEDALDYLSVSFKSDGTWNTARIVGFDSANVPLNQFNSGVTKDGGNYTILNGEHCPDEYLPSGSEPKCSGYTIQDAKITGFHRVSVGDTFTVTIGDGPDCYNGSNSITEPEHPEWGRRNKECGTFGGTYYVKRVR